MIRANAGSATTGHSSVVCDFFCDSSWGSSWGSVCGVHTVQVTGRAIVLSVPSVIDGRVESADNTRTHGKSDHLGPVTGAELAAYPREV